MATDYVGYFDQSFRDGHCDRVEIGSDCTQAQTQGFDWYTSRTTEWVYYRGKFATSRLCDLSFGCRKNSLVIFRFPGNELFDQGEEFLSLCFCGLRRKIFSGVVNERCKNYGSTRRKWSSRPPGVEI